MEIIVFDVGCLFSSGNEPRQLGKLDTHREGFGPHVFFSSIGCSSWRPQVVPMFGKALRQCEYSSLLALNVCIDSNALTHASPFLFAVSRILSDT